VGDRSNSIKVKYLANYLAAAVCGFLFSVQGYNMVGSDLRFLLGFGRTGTGIAVGVLIMRFIAVRKGKTPLPWPAGVLCFLSLLMVSGALVYDYYNYTAELDQLPCVQAGLLIGATLAGLVGLLNPFGAKAR
jgi:hypothetical protein